MCWVNLQFLLLLFLVHSHHHDSLRISLFKPIAYLWWAHSLIQLNFHHHTILLLIQSFLNNSECKLQCWNRVSIMSREAMLLFRIFHWDASKFLWFVILSWWLKSYLFYLLITSLLSAEWVHFEFCLVLHTIIFAFKVSKEKLSDNQFHKHIDIKLEKWKSKWKSHYKVKKWRT